VQPVRERADREDQHEPRHSGERGVHDLDRTLDHGRYGGKESLAVALDEVDRRLERAAERNLVRRDPALESGGALRRSGILCIHR
jgi:hypothetical protein